MPTDFIEQVGPMAIGSRLRRLAERITDEARHTYEMYGVAIEPRWWPVFYVLSLEEEGLSTTEIARRIGHSHASVSQITAEMTDAGLLSSERSEADGRVNVIRLTGSARALLPRHRVQCADVSDAVDEILAECGGDLWTALGELEGALDRRSLVDRVKERYRRRELEKVRIVDFEDTHAGAFRDLNLAWIREHWEVEESDRRMLDHPRETILDRGGAILMAICESGVVGTVALNPLGDGRYELAKMAVDPGARGRGIGEALGRALIERARELGADSLYLETNSILEPAIRLYEKLGFRPAPSQPSPYCRCNVQMEMEL